MAIVETYLQLHKELYNIQWKIKTFETLLLEGIDLKNIFPDIYEILSKESGLVCSNQHPWKPLAQISNIIPMGDYIHITIDFIGKNNEIYTKIIKYYDDKIEVVEGYSR